MNLSVLVQVCGVPLLVVIGILATLLVGLAIYLVVVAKLEELLAAFVPLTLLPALAGLLVTFLDSLSSIGLQVDGTADVAMEPGFLMQMNLIPLLTGLVAGTPGMIIAIAGRWALAWRNSGIRWMPERGPDDPSSTGDRAAQEAWVAKEADEYLEKLARPR
jgi:hypothetical protein